MANNRPTCFARLSSLRLYTVERWFTDVALFSESADSCIKGSVSYFAFTDVVNVKSSRRKARCCRGSSSSAVDYIYALLHVWPFKYL